MRSTAWKNRNFKTTPRTQTHFLTLTAAKALTPTVKRAAHLWADEKRVLGAGAAEPGKWNSRRAPWVVAITEAMADPIFAEIIAALGAQMSKTEGVLINGIGHQMDEHPATCMYVGPTRNNVESVSKDRVSTMIRSVPSLYAALEKGRNNTVNAKKINGNALYFCWAGSSTELASRPVQTVYLDEVDRMPRDVGGEGDPYTLVKARTSTFKGKGLVVAVSTPTGGLITVDDDDPLKRWQPADGQIDSLIWSLWQGGTRFEWAWPCPHCLDFFIAKSSLLYIPESESLKEVEQSAALICPHCGSEVIDHDHKNASHYELKRYKNWLNARGLFVAPGQSISRLDDVNAKGVRVVNDDGEEHFVEFAHYLAPAGAHKMASFWVSGLCSPWRTFGERAGVLVKAQRSMNPGEIKAAYNVDFGECFEITGDAPSWTLVSDRRRDYASGQVPAGVRVLVAGVDVQGDRLVVAIRGFGAGPVSFLIAAFEIFGSTNEDRVWEELAQLRHERYAGFAIKRMLVDSGYNPSARDLESVKHRVYQFCQEQGDWAVPSKGHKDQDQPWRWTRLDGYRNQRLKLKLVHFSGDFYKQTLYAEIGREDGGVSWVIPSDAADEYCRQVVSEVRIPSGRSFKWQPIRRDNHFLDCEVLCLVAADIERVRMLKEKTPVNLNDPIELKEAPALTKKSVKKIRKSREVEC